MPVNAASSKNALSVATAKGIKESHLQNDFNTNKGSGRKFTPFSKTLDFTFYPVWASLSRKAGRKVFRVLGTVLGNTKLYAVIGASYLRYLAAKEGN